MVDVLVHFVKCMAATQSWLFRQKRTATEDTLSTALGSMREFVVASEEGGKQQHVDDGVKERWTPPEGSYKINSDATVFEDGTVGCGGIMRDVQREVLGATCLLIEGIYGIDVAEVVSARHALSIALEAELQRVVLETK